jgi:hypothetical protein
VLGGGCDADALALLRLLLVYDPARRVAARAALAHPFFRGPMLPVAPATLQAATARRPASREPAVL